VLDPRRQWQLDSRAIINATLQSGFHIEWSHYKQDQLWKMFAADTAAAREFHAAGLASYATQRIDYPEDGHEIEVTYKEVNLPSAYVQRQWIQHADYRKPETTILKVVDEHFEEAEAAVHAYKASMCLEAYQWIRRNCETGARAALRVGPVYDWERGYNGHEVTATVYPVLIFKEASDAAFYRLALA
jgi:hypothetical protein